MIDPAQDNGDSRLTINDRKLWSLTYECLRRFSCPVIFKESGPDVPNRVNRLIEFFVPRDHGRRDAVVAFLRDELKSELRTPTEDVDFGWQFGCFVHVRMFSGVSGFMEREDAEAMAEAFSNDLMDGLKRKSIDAQVKKNRH